MTLIYVLLLNNYYVDFSLGLQKNSNLYSDKS